MSMEYETEDLDDSADNADWTKKTWDLPPYKSKEFFQVINHSHLAEFRNSPTYKFAVQQGLIHDDEWTGD